MSATAAGGRVPTTVHRVLVIATLVVVWVVLRLGTVASVAGRRGVAVAYHERLGYVS
jgi:hypothetical protein